MDQSIFANDIDWIGCSVRLPDVANEGVIGVVLSEFTLASHEMTTEGLERSLEFVGVYILENDVVAKSFLVEDPLVLLDGRVRWRKQRVGSDHLEFVFEARLAEGRKEHVKIVVFLDIDFFVANDDTLGSPANTGSLKDRERLPNIVSASGA